MMKKLFGLLGLFPSLLAAAAPPPTLVEMAGLSPRANPLAKSVVVVIDAQREYVDGALPLAGIEPALEEGARLLRRARAAGTPIIHVVHRGGPGLFDPAGPYFQIAALMKPEAGERVVEKTLPNAFAATDLREALTATGRDKLIVVGFMTHMCVSSTVRAALDLGFTTTVVAAATATRALPDGQGNGLTADQVQRATLAALADRFATVVPGVDGIPD